MKLAFGLLITACVLAWGSGNVFAATIIGTNGNDIDPNFCVLQGGVHKDKIFGLDGIDELCGLQDGDKLYMGRGADTGFGGKGPDMIFGSYGNDNLWGMRGNDYLSDMYGNNVFDCGLGIDVVRTNSISLGNIHQNCEYIFSSDGDLKLRQVRADG